MQLTQARPKHAPSINGWS